MRWQSATAPRTVCSSVTSSTKSTQGTAKSGPTLPLIIPMAGVRTATSWEEPPPDLDPEEELLSYFEELKTFAADVARREHALLVFIGE